jgi:hypothetical protein
MEDNTVTLDTTQSSGPPAPAVVTEATDDVVLSAAQLRRTDYVRAGLTFGLLAIFALVLGFAGFETSNDKVWANAKEFLNIALPAVSGLLGSVIGFYFGSRSDRSSGQR